jgi:hypothetical protein
MLFKETVPGKLYFATIQRPFYFNNRKNIYSCASKTNPVNILFSVNLFENDTVTNIIHYHILATNPSVHHSTIPLNQEVSEIPMSDLPLFLNYPNISPTFESLIKGTIHLPLDNSIETSYSYIYIEIEKNLGNR